MPDSTWRYVRIGLRVLVVVLALLPPFALPPFRVFQLTVLLAFAIALLGLNLLVGYSGQISLGHGAFFALGAYTAAILMDRFDAAATYLAALPVAMLLCFAVGLALGIPALRLRGLYLALGTLALSVVTPPLLRRFDSLTGGATGIRVDQPSAPGVVGLAQDQWLYLLALVVFAAGLAWLVNLRRGRVGRALVAIRENDIAAASMGVALPRNKALAFAVASTYAGVGGVVYTWTIGFVSPESFGLLLSIDLLAGLVVGGIATTFGPLLGAAFLQYVPIFAEQINDAMPGVVFGALLIAVVLVAPHGLAGLLRRLLQPLSRRVARMRPAGEA